MPDSEIPIHQRLSEYLPIAERRVKRPPALFRSAILLALAVILALAAAVADAYLHRGIETSAGPPYVNHVSGNGLATNLDLRAFPPSQIETIAATIRASGFRYVRHPLLWEDIEPVEGEFHWEQYDALFRSFEDAGIEVIAVVSGIPDWARSVSGLEAVDAPPADVNAYAEFVGSVAERYVQYLHFVQIFDHPNDPERWGGAIAEPHEYVSLLVPSFNAVRSSNPGATVILAELSPTGPGDQLGDDTRFLEGVYEAGGAPYFDVVAAKIDGGNTSPYDRRIRRNEPSLSRAILFREVVHDNDDDRKPIWLTHYGWDSAGAVDRATQADFVVAGIERTREEWPWTGLVFQWGLQPDTLPESEAGFALLNQDGTATEAFVAVSELANSEVGVIAPTGFVPTTSEAIAYRGTWSDQHLMDRVFQTTSEVSASMTMRFEGSGISAFLRRGPEAGLIHATLDGEPLPGWPSVDGVSTIDLRFFQAEDVTVRLASDLEDGVHELELVLADQGNLTVGGAVVSRDPPVRWPVVVVLISALALAALAIRRIALALARSSGVIREEDQADSIPRLPSLPDWRPSMKT